MKEIKLNENSPSVEHPEDIVLFREEDDLQTGGKVMKATVNYQEYGVGYIVLKKDISNAAYLEQAEDHVSNLLMNMVYGKLYRLWIEAYPRLLYNKDPELHTFAKALEKFFHGYEGGDR